MPEPIIELRLLREFDSEFGENALATAEIGDERLGCFNKRLESRRHELSTLERMADIADPFERSSWVTAHSRLLTFFDDVGATERTSTTVYSLRSVETRSRANFYGQLDVEIGGDLPWQAITFLHTDDDGCTGFALPVSSKWDFDDPCVIFYLDIHMSLAAWWLTTAWRVRQLADAALELFESKRVVAAASCVRPLLETGASFWIDARKIADAWTQTKEEGPFQTDAESPSKLNAIWARLSEAMLGAKFDERAPHLRDDWGFIARSNVLGSVEKLANVCGGSLQDDYQWLCNTVHPSLGNTLVFAEPWFAHPSKTFDMKYFAAQPSGKAPGHPIPTDPEYAEQQFLIHRAVARAAEAAINVVTSTMDASLRIIDDVALTTGTPTASRTQYWRMTVRPERNDLCPCRWGRKSKWCRHTWGFRGR